MTRILAIESSCDETAAAVVEDGRRILSNVIATQIPVHRVYGGVVPEIAGRHHLEAISPVTLEALAQAGCGFDDLDAIAVTAGPGLVGSLLVGVSYAKALAMARGMPLIAVHHWLGHLQAVRLEHELDPPYLALVASGSHSGLIEITAGGRRFLGRSRDDAAGEAFDKIARALGLPYPGGPAIAKAALSGDAGKYEFPRAWLEDSDDFSFSGLKSAVLNHLNHRRMTGGQLSAGEICDVAASAQEAICDVLSAKAVAAASRLELPTIVLAGGVAANARLRELLGQRAKEAGIAVLWPSPVLCTDNAAMIAAAAYDQFLAGDFADLRLNADPRLPLG